MLKTIAFLSAILGFGCSMDIVPVAPDRVKMVKYAEQPLLRGPGAPGAFKYVWEFQSAKGYLFDPTELEIQSPVMRAKTAKSAMLVTHLSAPFVALDSFQETAGPGNRGSFVYQLSPNNSAWYFHDKTKWVLAGPTPAQANTAADVSAAIGKFHLEVGMGSLNVRVFFLSKGEKDFAELQSFSVQGILPAQDSAD